MGPQATTTLTARVRKKPSSKTIFDPSRRWMKYYTRHMEPELYDQLATWAAAHGLCVEQALNLALRAGLKALPL